MLYTMTLAVSYSSPKMAAKIEADYSVQMMPHNMNMAGSAMDRYCPHPFQMKSHWMIPVQQLLKCP